LSDYHQQGVVIGGIAASILGKSRLTFDIDAVFLLSLEEIPGFIEAASKYGIEPRIVKARDFAQKNRVILLKHSASDTEIDISLGVLPFEIEMVARAQQVEIDQIQLRIPTAEDLIILKSIAHRPKDLEDIRAVARNHPDLDRGRIRFWVEQFGEALDQPDLWEMIEKLL